MAPGFVRTKVSEAARRRGAGWWARLWPESGAVSPIPALDGLRTLAVVLVMLFHSWWYMPGQNAQGPQQGTFAINYARTGVPLFFVLSGFLLFLPYARWLFGLRPRPSTRLFYKRRALRVGPAYWASLVILVLAAPLTASALFDGLVHAAYLSSFFPDYFYSINGVYWSMAVEVQFYVLLPAIGWLAYLLSRRLPPLVAGALTVMALLGVSLGVRSLTEAGALAANPGLQMSLLGFPGMPFWLSTFGNGIACAIAAVYLTEVICLPRFGVRCMRAAGLLAYVGGIAFALVLALVPRMHSLRNQYLLFGLAFTGLVVGVLFGPHWVRRPFEWRPVRFVGLISYSVYIWHNVVLRLILPHVTAIPDPRQQVAAAFILDVLASIPVAYVSFQLTERPFFQLRRRAHESAPDVVTSDRREPRDETSAREHAEPAVA